MTKITKLYGETQIAERVTALAAEIAAVLPNDFLMVGLLKGSFVFVADLIRALDRLGCRPGVEFMRLSSYGSAKQSSGEVHLIGDVPTAVADRAILLVDDIVDTGRSISYARTLLLERGATQIWTCALLDKPSRREVEVPADFVGFAIPDLFVVGYGIDYAEGYRHLCYIGTVD